MISYRLTEEAAFDLEEIHSYIANDSFDAADRFLDRIHAAMLALASEPGLGHVREDLTHRPLRFWSVGSYLIIYRPERTPLEVIGVLHGARDVAAVVDDRD